MFPPDKPTVRIGRVDGGRVLEEGVASLSLSCISESNPPAQVMWTRRGQGVDSAPQYTEVSILAIFLIFLTAHCFRFLSSHL